MHEDTKGFLQGEPVAGVSVMDVVGMGGPARKIPDQWQPSTRLPSAAADARRVEAAADAADGESALGYSSNLCATFTDYLAGHGRYAERIANPPKAEWAVGGTYGRIAFGESFGSCRSRGDRKACLGFSRASRRAMIRFLSQIPDQPVMAVCLTWPEQFPTPREGKTLMRAWFCRIWRAWGPRGVVWKLEPQKRLAPHFHLILQLKGIELSQYSSLICWLKQAWYEVVESGIAAHLEYGCDCSVVQCREHYGAYAAKYAAKEQWAAGYAVTDDGELIELSQDWQEAGRWWGKEKIDEWGIQIKSVICDEGHVRWVDRMVRRHLDAAARYAVATAKDRKIHKRASRKLRRIRKLLRSRRPPCSRTLVVSGKAVEQAVASYPPCLIEAAEGRPAVRVIPGVVDPEFWHLRMAKERLADLWEQERGGPVTWGPEGPEWEYHELPA